MIGTNQTQVLILPPQMPRGCGFDIYHPIQKGDTDGGICLQGLRRRKRVPVQTSKVFPVRSLGDD